MLSKPTNIQIADAVHIGQTTSPPRLNIHIIFTNADGTRHALSATEQLGYGLDVCVNLLVAQVVPYPLPLDEPDISSAFTRQHLLKLVARAESEIQVRIQLCRDRVSAIRAALPPKSIVLIGDHYRRWWPCPGARLAKQLRRDGHKVILVDSGAPLSELLKHEHPDFIQRIS